MRRAHTVKTESLERLWALEGPAAVPSVAPKAGIPAINAAIQECV
jgi:hypothetical protein